MKCVKCGSGFGYVRIKDGGVVCRACGHIEPPREAFAKAEENAPSVTQDTEPTK
jgi:uncharacterized Zn finger protein (UPF0148 family)